MRTAAFKADSVRFYNEDLFGDEFLLGKFQNKLVKEVREDRPAYPKFDSYNKKIVLSKLIDNVDFIGGYSLHGNDFISNSESGDYAKLVFFRNDLRFIEAITDRITITNNRVIASNSAIKIFIGNDSIVHPGLDLKFHQDDLRLDLIRDKQGISSAPYLNTYHRLDMDFQLLQWNMSQDVISFGTMPAVTSKPAIFESSNFYSDQHFNSLLGIDKIHPLVRIRDFVKNKEIGDEFFVEDFILFSNLSSEQANRFLIWMSAEGFVLYNLNTGKVQVKDRLYRYLAAKSQNEDYDVISFKSSEPKNNKNALLDLNTMDLTIYGVDAVQVSDARDVIAIPRNNQIVVQENRNFSMSGTLIAGSGGRFHINCESIYFNYDQFRMQFKDAVTEIRIPNNKELYDEEGELELELLESEITIANGELLIDTTINKSGVWKEYYPEYPIIKSYDNSHVYYDKKEIFDGVYNRESFFFNVDPFEIDSLDIYTRESLSFPGEFYSSDILPNFRQELRVQADNSLGFIINTPDEGYQLYIDKGYFYPNNKISLDKSGLRGVGKLNCLTSLTESDDYVFFPDSMNTYASVFDLSSDNNIFPNVHGEEVSEHWEPYNDKLFVYKEMNDLVMYDDQVLLDGSVCLEPGKLTGNGLVKMEESEIISKLYNFNIESFHSDTADFRLNRSDLDAIAFQSVNVKTEIDLIERSGFFKSNGSGSFVTFPENQYICFIDELKWLMDEDKVNLGSSEFGSGSKFVSIKPDQDSLEFIAISADYALNDYIIKAKGVKEILVADAVISPNQGDVVVETDAYMRLLNNAIIRIDSLDSLGSYHELFNAEINIDGKNSYRGSAVINYKGFEIEDQSIQLDTLFVIDGQTVGFGTIDEGSNFSFNQQFGFKGDVRLEGTNIDLYYDGGYKIKHQCSIIENTWVEFSAYVGVENMRLPIKDAKDLNGKELAIGPIISESGIYPAFLSPVLEESDVVVMPLTGHLYYDNDRDQFIVKDDIDSVSNTFSMNNSDCIMKGRGFLNLGLNLGRVDLTNVGDFTYSPMSNSCVMNTMLSLDFYINDKLIDQIGVELIDDPMADELEIREKFHLPIFDLILKNEDLTFEYDMYGEFEVLPKELNKSLYFYDVSLEWNGELNSFVSKDMLGLGNVLSHQVNKLYNGSIELLKDNSGDQISMYLETDIGEWYYFSYSNELMLTRSSLDDYNLILLETKTGKRKAPSKKNQSEYQYDLCSEEEVDNFKKRFFE